MARITPEARTLIYVLLSVIETEAILLLNYYVSANGRHVATKLTQSDTHTTRIWRGEALAEVDPVRRLNNRVRIHITSRANAALCAASDSGFSLANIVHPDDPIIAHPQHLTISLFDGLREEHIRSAARTSTLAFVDAQDGYERVMAAAVAASAGYYPIPATEVGRLAARLAVPPVDLVVTDAQLEALRLLHNGGSVGQLAHLWNLSPRQARRRARVLWKTLGAATPTQAVAHAVRWGLI